MPFSAKLVRKLLSAVASRPLLAVPPAARQRLLYSRVSPIAALAGGAVGVTGIATYLSRSPAPSTSLADEGAAVPSSRPSPATNPLPSSGGPPSFVNPVRAHDLASADEVLKREEKSTLFALGNGQHGRCDSVRVPSNCPVEDELADGTAEGPGGQPWVFWGVYDGHAGWATSAVLRDSLIQYVSRTLSTLPPDAAPTAVTSAIQSAFRKLDDDINAAALGAMHSNPETSQPGSAAVVAAIAPAIAGSCALLSVYDPRTSTLRVACTGDSRAVLGRHDPSSSGGGGGGGSSSSYIALPMSVDQTGKNPAEYSRVAAAHPGEDAAILDRASGRLLGLAVTRAFGDHRWKWDEAAIREAQQRYFGSSPRPGAATPPYLTAEPVVVEECVAVAGGRTDFLIMASDGFWDHVSNDDAVECVARWIDARRAGRLGGRAVDGGAAAAAKGVAQEQETNGAEKKPDWWLDEGRYVEWRATPEHFVVEDDNAASHLVRNAFGGARRSLYCGVMTAYPPISRNVRDDCTVQVIFFGDV